MVLIEVSHFLSSVMGLVLVLLAFGLRARLDAAWAATMAALLVAAPAGAAQGLQLGGDRGAGWRSPSLLAPFRGAFPRKARADPDGDHAGLAVLGRLLRCWAPACSGLWSFQNADYGDQPWWRVMADADAARAIRAWAGAAIALFGFGVWRLLASAATPPVVGEDDPRLRPGPRHPGQGRGRRARLQPGAARRQAVPVLGIAARAS